MWDNFTSIAEVGVGVNFAFGALRQVREGFSERFFRMFEGMRSQITAQMKDRAAKDELATALIQRETDDAASGYKEKSARYEGYAQIAATVVGLACASILVAAASAHQLDSESWYSDTHWYCNRKLWAIGLGLLIWFPVLSNFVAQRLCFNSAKQQLARTNDKINNAMKDIGINPTAP